VPVSWPPEVDEVLAGDLTAALVYVTPAGGAVATAVAPIGLRDPDAGTVTFTTSLGFGQKLERIRKNPKVALVFHAREHGFCDRPLYVVVQGTAEFTIEPDQQLLDEVVQPAATRHLGPPKSGRLFWDRWLREYYADRVPVEVSVERITVWPDLEARGEPTVHGSPRPGDASPQNPPKKGTTPRVPVERAARRLAKLPHSLLAFTEADGFPTAVPVDVGEGASDGIRMTSAPGLIPAGGRRAGILSHSYHPKLIGLEARQHTGWVEADSDGAIYSPHTEQGFKAPANKTVLLFFNGLLAKRGLKKARREGRLERTADTAAAS
jgi:hypothetical protein